MIHALVIAEHNNQQLALDTLHAVSAALILGGKVDVLVSGDACQGVAKQASALLGISRVLLAHSPNYRYQLAEPLSGLTVACFQQVPYTHIVTSANAFGKNLLPRIAALLDVAPISDVIRLWSAHQFVRPIYAGSLIETVESLDPVKMLSVRSTAFEKAVYTDVMVPITPIMHNEIAHLSKYVTQHLTCSKRPELTAAKVIVAGGKGLGSSEQFHALLDPLADQLGAAIGASRAAVDAGYVPNTYQIGQTGKVVAPELYLAIGISGAIQHLTGMKDAKVIIAINKNPEEPIFQVADYGIVGDLFDIVPALHRALQDLM